MIRHWILVSSLALTLLGVGCKPAPTPASTPVVNAPEIDPVRGHLLHAQPKLKTIKVWLGDQEVVAEIAFQPTEVATGMMFRTNFPDGEAMLFVFRDVAPRSFYMRNCKIDLDGTYITPSGEISQIVAMKKMDETPIPSDSNEIQFVLELPTGWCARHNIKPGVIVRTEHGPLWETFFKRP
ncbi:MAG: hypothetical protein RLZZ350_2220 [Verrucomicrobiota bacterium]|jgi:uncharacterized membrane protein (UPF0127 family)